MNYLPCFTISLPEVNRFATAVPSVESPYNFTTNNDDRESASIGPLGVHYPQTKRIPARELARYSSQPVEKGICRLMRLTRSEVFNTVPNGEVVQRVTTTLPSQPFEPAVCRDWVVICPLPTPRRGCRRRQAVKRVVPPQWVHSCPVAARLKAFKTPRRAAPARC